MERCLDRERFIWTYDIYVYSEEDRENKLSVIKKYLTESDISMASADLAYNMPYIHIRCTPDVFNNIRFDLDLDLIHIWI